MRVGVGPGVDMDVAGLHVEGEEGEVEAAEGLCLPCRVKVNHAVVVDGRL